MIKLKGNALWTNKRKSFLIQYIVNLPNSLPRGVIEANAVAGYPSGLDNFMTVIKIRSPARQDNGEGDPTRRCSPGGGGRREKERSLVPCATHRAGGTVCGTHRALKRRVQGLSTALQSRTSASGEALGQRGECLTLYQIASFGHLFLPLSPLVCSQWAHAGPNETSPSALAESWEFLLYLKFLTAPLIQGWLSRDLTHLDKYIPQHPERHLLYDIDTH